MLAHKWSLIAGLTLVIALTILTQYLTTFREKKTTEQLDCFPGVPKAQNLELTIGVGLWVMRFYVGNGQAQVQNIDACPATPAPGALPVVCEDTLLWLARGTAIVSPIAGAVALACVFLQRFDRLGELSGTVAAATCVGTLTLFLIWWDRSPGVERLEKDGGKYSLGSAAYVQISVIVLATACAAMTFSYYRRLRGTAADGSALDGSVAPFSAAEIQEGHQL